jgi:ATP-dependent protease ClpP protease subunit
MKEDSDSDTECDFGKECVQYVNNSVYFYSTVTRKSVLKLITILEKIQQSIQRKNITENYIDVYIHSEGGELFAGISAMNYIQNMNIHVNTIADGFVGSAATLIFLGGHYTYMQRYSTMLVHQMTTGFYGKYEEFMEEAKNSKKIMETVKSIYTDKTNIPCEILKEYLKKDIYIDAHTCKKYNIVHEVYD